MDLRTARLVLSPLLAALLLLVLPACGGASRSKATPPPQAAAQGDGEVFEITADKPFRWKGRAGARLQIENVNGSITATTGDGPDVEIVAELIDDDEGSAGIVLTRGADGLAFCVRAAHMERETPPSCHGHTRERHGHARGVRVTVRVPQGLHLVARTVNGRVHVRGLVGRVEADAVNGQVLLEDVRDVHASSVNGQVRASFADGPLPGPIELSTVNGAVSVMLPAGTDALVHADTVRGHVAIDMPGAVDVHDSRHVRVALGHGGHELSLHTVHGSIRVAERGRE